MNDQQELTPDRLRKMRSKTGQFMEGGCDYPQVSGCPNWVTRGNAWMGRTGSATTEWFDCGGGGKCPDRGLSWQVNLSWLKWGYMSMAPLQACALFATVPELRNGGFGL